MDIACGMHRACMFEHVHSLTYVWVFVCLHVDTVCVGVGDGMVSGVGCPCSVVFAHHRA